VARHLARFGIDTEMIVNDPVMPNVVATVGNGAGPHVVLNVHLDTMPPGDESTWSVPVYSLTNRDGRLYGLGMGNMKGAVAAATVAFRLLHQRRADWRGRVTLAAVSDECVFGDNGSAHLLASRADLVGDALLCGEGPGFGRIAAAEKGVAWYQLAASATAGHSSRVHRGASATARIATAIAALDDLNDVVVAAPAGLDGLAADDSEALRLSVNVGELSGGSFVSQVATAAVARLDVRLPPGLTIDWFESELGTRLAGIEGVTWSRLKGWEANWSPMSDPFVEQFAATVRQVRGADPGATVRLPASDASRWRQRGVPAVCYGPQPTLSAGVDDYAHETDVLACAKIYAVSTLRRLAFG
jgi:succinyl-diaminopimelate desuccinylase